MDRSVEQENETEDGYNWNYNEKRKMCDVTKQNTIRIKYINGSIPYFILLGVALIQNELREKIHYGNVMSREEVS